MPSATQQPVGLIMIDVDHFKAINDSRGHAAGDSVLRIIASGIASVVRPYDSVGRCGGEEFLIVAPGCGMAEDSGSWPKRVRSHVAGCSINACRIDRSGQPEPGRGHRPNCRRDRETSARRRRRHVPGQERRTQPCGTGSVPRRQPRPNLLHPKPRLLALGRKSQDGRSLRQAQGRVCLPLLTWLLNSIHQQSKSRSKAADKSVSPTSGPDSTPQATWTIDFFNQRLSSNVSCPAQTVGK